ASGILKKEAGLAIHPSRCSLCRHRRVTVGFAAETMVGRRASEPAVPTADRQAAPMSPQPPLVDPTARGLESHLRARPGYWFCAHCLAKDLSASAVVMRDAMWGLDSVPGFLVRSTQC